MKSGVLLGHTTDAQKKLVVGDPATTRTPSIVAQLFHNYFDRAHLLPCEGPCEHAFSECGAPFLRLTHDHIFDDQVGTNSRDVLTAYVTYIFSRITSGGGESFSVFRAPGVTSVDG